MTEQELREQIGKLLSPYIEGDSWFKAMDITSQILASIKEAGYKSPEEARELSVWSVDDSREIDRAKWALSNGYVKLEKDLNK